MTLKEQIQQDVISAMRSGDEVRKRTLRLALAAIKNQEIEVGRALSDADVTAILQKEARQRRETLEELKQVDRPALAASERAELEVLNEYLPQQLGREEIAVLARQAIDQVNATGPRDIGDVMRVLMPKVGAQADSKVVGQVVRNLLGS